MPEELHPDYSLCPSCPEIKKKVDRIDQALLGKDGTGLNDDGVIHRMLLKLDDLESKNKVSAGQDPKETEFKSWMFSSYGNTKDQGGFLNKSDIDLISSQLPEVTRRQEILGETLAGEGVVFRNIVSRIRENIKPCQPGETVYVGSDLAKNLDYYVNIAIRQNGEVIAFERYNKLDWVFMRHRALEFCRRFGNAFLLIVSTGVGDPVFDEMKREYGNVQGYKLTNPTKKALIENLSIMLDNEEIWFPGNPQTKEFSSALSSDFPVLRAELESFTYELAPSGLIHYGAPEGLHDDTVITLALAAWQIKNLERTAEPSWVMG